MHKCTHIIGKKHKNVHRDHFCMLIYECLHFYCNSNFWLKNQLKLEVCVVFKYFIVSTWYSSVRKIQVTEIYIKDKIYDLAKYRLSSYIVNGKYPFYLFSAVKEMREIFICDTALWHDVRLFWFCKRLLCILKHD